LDRVRGLDLREPICADLVHLELITSLGLLELFCGLGPLERITRIELIRGLICGMGLPEQLLSVKI